MDGLSWVRTVLKRSGKRNREGHYGGYWNIWGVRRVERDKERDRGGGTREKEMEWDKKQ